MCKTLKIWNKELIIGPDSPLKTFLYIYNTIYLNCVIPNLPWKQWESNQSHSNIKKIEKT